MPCRKQSDSSSCRLGDDCATCPLPSFLLRFDDPDGPIQKLALYVQSSANLYYEHKGDDSGLRYDAARLIEGRTTEELRCLLVLHHDFVRAQRRSELDIKMRVGMRRGWDLFNVACLSRF